MVSSIAALEENDHVLLCRKDKATGFLFHHLSPGGHFIPVDPGLVHVEVLLRVLTFFLDDLLPLFGVLRSFFRVCRCLLPTEDGTRS